MSQPCPQRGTACSGKAEAWACLRYDRTASRGCLRCPGKHSMTRMSIPWPQVVLVVLMELRMSPGKIGAQCAHAALGLYRKLVSLRVPWLSAWEVRERGCRGRRRVCLPGSCAAAGAAASPRLLAA